MKITILAAGKIKNGPLRDLERDYRNRLKHYRAEVKEISDEKHALPRVVLEREEKKLTQALQGFSRVVLLDEGGKRYTSRALASHLETLENQGTARCAFVVGSAFGLTETLKKRFPDHLRLSDFTLPHELARVVLLEQLYRSFTIRNGIPYHH